MTRLKLHVAVIDSNFKLVDTPYCTKNTYIHDRLYKNCSDNLVEDEVHLLLLWDVLTLMTLGEIL